MSRNLQERLLQLNATLEERRANDPLSNFTLHDKQKAFVDSVLEAEVGENWFIAANRAGKSDAGAYAGAHLARFGTKQMKMNFAQGVEVRDRATAGWVSALDFPTSRDVIEPKYFDNGFVPAGQAHPPFIPKHEIAEWRVSDRILKLKNGSIIGFKSADSGRSKYQGAEKDWIHMDEEHPHDIYEEAVIRVGARQLLFFCTATILPPEGAVGGSSWVFSEVIQPFQQGRLHHARVFGASIYDNPAIALGEIARLESIYPEGSISRRIRLGGEWLPGLSGARAYGAFDRALHVAPQPEINFRRPLVWTWDFNVNPMCSIVCQVDGNVYRVHKELIINDASIPEMCQLFYHHFPHHGAEIHLYGDATSNRRTGQTGQTDYFVILNEMKAYGVPVRLLIPPENPKVPDRINAVNGVMRAPDGSIRLSIDPSCEELIKDMEGVLRDQRGGIKKVSNAKDPYFFRTHTSDALGYWLSYVEPVRPPSDAFSSKVRIPRPSYGSNA